MYNIITDFIPANDIEEEVRIFSPYFSDLVNVSHKHTLCDDVVYNTVTINERTYQFHDIMPSDCDENRTKRLKRICKSSVYNALKDFTGVSMPWGSLTGIRPTKLAYEYLSEGGALDSLSDYMVKNFDILPKKAEIIKNIVLCQTEYKTDSPEFVNLYVHIPFCTTRCTYCAFITHVADKCEKLMHEYTDLLIREINASVAHIDRLGKRIYSIYVGGGTPTALPDECFAHLMEALSGHNVEFTCEAGRPDTITERKLQIMKECGVSRVCVNPQTLCEKTLRVIGRKHTVKDFYDVYEMVKHFDFDINVDLIAGLPGEGEQVFCESVCGVRALMPQNITVHTLSIKNGSKLKNDGALPVPSDNIARMVESAYDIAVEAGYTPYYLYRQKNMLGNLENIGYCLPGTQCANNITTMEEFLPVVACGAGAISKNIYPNNRIERFANLRDAKLYVEQFEERLEKKLKFFEN